MEKLSILLQCEICGLAFLYQRECHDHMEAMALEKWARKHRKTCSTCYKNEQKKATEMWAEMLNLPEIDIGSEKQIAFANSLRERFVKRNRERMLFAYRQLHLVNPSMVPPAAQKRNLAEEDCVPEAFRRIGFEKEYTCLTQRSAKIIIETLK